MHAGRIEEADGLANIIRADIIRCNTAHFKGSDDGIDARYMWTMLATRANHCVTSTGVSAQILNSLYASISQDLSYKIPCRKLTASCNINHLSTWRVFIVLDHLKNTAVGLDDLPA